MTKQSMQNIAGATFMMVALVSLLSGCATEKPLVYQDMPRGVNVTVAPQVEDKVCTIHQVRLKEQEQIQLTVNIEKLASISSDGIARLCVLPSGFAQDKAKDAQADLQTIDMICIDLMLSTDSYRAYEYRTFHSVRALKQSPWFRLEHLNKQAGLGVPVEIGLQRKGKEVKLSLYGKVISTVDLPNAGWLYLSCTSGQCTFNVPE